MSCLDMMTEAQPPRTSNPTDHASFNTKGSRLVQEIQIAQAKTTVPVLACR